MSATDYRHKTTTGMEKDHAGTHPASQEDAERWKQDNHQPMKKLNRNGIRIQDNDRTLENLTVDAATEEKTAEQLAQHLRELLG
ncbi:hypothetical protein [Pantoea sp. B65]|uniref:hypothetical protein n=1 Tax=Pantoea sp. B65 TaxID=2813359 RepID=UPI0039B39357